MAHMGRLLRAIMMRWTGIWRLLMYRRSHNTCRYYGSVLRHMEVSKTQGHLIWTQNRQYDPSCKDHLFMESYSMIYLNDT